MQELKTTQDLIQYYADSIEQALKQYCIDREIKLKDLYTIDQSRWNSVLLYIHRYTFKPLESGSNRENSCIDYSNIELLKAVCNIYIAMCCEYSKEVSILGFSKMTGINPDTIYSWGKEEYRASGGNSDIYKNLNREREESLSAKLASGKGNPVGILGILNRHYGWNMGQPRGQEQRQTAPSIPDMARKYGIEQAETAQIPQFPKEKETDN